jgi:L1 cell adhesion molecule
LCKHCHHECEETCTGPGPGNCTICKHVKDGPYCVPACPTSKFNDSGNECLSCHENCVGGCTGPENNIGPRGCRSCEKAVINGDVEVVSTTPVNVNFNLNGFKWTKLKFQIFLNSNGIRIAV